MLAVISSRISRKVPPVGLPVFVRSNSLMVTCSSLTYESLLFNLPKPNTATSAAPEGKRSC